MKVKVQTLQDSGSSGKGGDIELNDAIFALEPRPDILHRVVTWQLTNRRAPARAARERSDVNRTGNALRALGLRKGFFGGEPGLQNPSVRANIEQTWQMRAMDANYGLADVLSIFGAECEVRDGLHFHGQGVLLLELIDPVTEQSIEIAGRAVGELVYTNLVRQAQPLVRYRSHDAAEIISTAPSIARATARTWTAARTTSSRSASFTTATNRNFRRSSARTSIRTTPAPSSAANQEAARTS